MAKSDGDMTRQVKEALADVRGMLASHGGDIEFLGVEEATGTVTVRLQGACVGCPMADATIKNLVEMTLRDRVPGVLAVINSPR
jgi:Fe-S cluster biogenesis protein NfuA